MQDFLNPRSMVTPGAAGGTVMLVANTLWMNFGVAQQWTALAVSAVISILIVTRYAAPLWERGCYFVLNALIIFCVAIGAATVGTVASGGGGGAVASREAPAALPQLAGLIGRAEAASDSEIEDLCGGDGAELDDRTRRLCRMLREQRVPPAAAPQAAPLADESQAAPLADESQGETQQQTSDPKPERRPFFSPWFQQGK